MSHEYPEVRSGGSLMLAWQARGRCVLVVGGGDVAAGRILHALNADAKVTVISPRDRLSPEVAHRIERKQVDYTDRKFEPSDLDGVDMVLVAVDDPIASSEIYKLCKERRVPANIADVPSECDFYFGSVHRDGPLQIMVSTNGNGPKLASIVRGKIAEGLPNDLGAAIANVGALRKKLRKIAPTAEEGPRRMQWMSKVCERWSLEDLCQMDENDMETLLGSYATNEIPQFSEIRATEGTYEFDGSFAARGQAAYTLYWGVLSGQNGLLLLQVRQISNAGQLPLLMSGDIDEKNLEYARKNVALNNLQPRIRIIQSIPSGPLIPLDSLQLESIDFTMCNPPFYESTEEMLSCAKEKKRPPFSACTGASVEMVTAGGEVAFVERMIKESLALRERVEWYTTMLGKLSSVSVVVSRLKEIGVQNWAITEFVQGTKTRRWAVGWSWGDMHPRMDVARGVTTLPKHLLPFPSEFTLHVPLIPPDEVGKRLDITLKSLPLHWQWRPAQAVGVGFARGNVWSRASRRKSQGPLGEMDKGDDDGPAIGFKVQVRSDEGAGGSGVRVRWMKGRDTVLFESFCGMLKRKAMAHDDS
ncbi:MAG: Bifunctional dehydrogenase and ferrochelatase [Geoglossum simile]|nr:MAG: Bifunctional dehydrogenase and ferrochelatase [Geoglossum simile]